MACSTCMKIRKALNVPLARAGLPTLPVTPTQTANPQPVAQQRVNPAWPVRTSGS